MSLIFCEPTFILMVATVIFGFIFWRIDKRRKQFILRNGVKVPVKSFYSLPMPSTYPVLGNILSLMESPHLMLTKWSEIYGPYYRCKMGWDDALVITGYDAIKKTGMRQSIAFAGRPAKETFKIMCEGYSLAFSNYSPTWQKQKDSARNAFRTYTEGKDRAAVEKNASKHMLQLLKDLESDADKDGIVNPRQAILVNTTNSICSVCFGKTFEMGDPIFSEFLSINQHFDKAMGAAQPVDFWPVLKRVPILRRPYNDLSVYAKAYWRFVSSLLKSHWDTYNPNVMRDIADCLNLESNKAAKVFPNNNLPHKIQVHNGNGVANGHANTNGHAAYEKTFRSEIIKTPATAADFDYTISKEELELRQRIAFTAGDIFGAGYDTMYTFVQWSFIYLAVYQDAQKKIRDEIIHAVPADQEASFMLHSRDCPYTQAWIYEVLRHTSLVPLLITHATTSSVVIDNYVIPKGITVLFNCYEAHMDPKVWDNPKEFNPSRFLIRNETDKNYTIRSEKVLDLLSWGFGKRRCLGEKLSKQLLFIYISTIVRRHLIEQSIPGIEPVVSWPAEMGLTIKPKPFRVKISKI